MSAITIALKDLKLRLRDRSAIIQGFVAPFALAAIISVAIGGGDDEFHPTYALVNLDNGPVAAAFEQVTTSEDFADSFTIKKAASVDEARKLMDAGSASGAFVLEAGLSDAVNAGTDASVTVLRNPSLQISGQVAQAIADGFASQVNASRLSVTTAVAAGGRPSPEQLAELSAQVQDVRLPVALVEGRVGTREISPASYFGPSMAIFFLFFTVQFGARSMLTERAEGTLARLRAAPIRPGSIIAGKILAVSVLGLASLGTLMVAISLVFGAELGDPLAVAAICVAIVFAAMSITALVISFAKTGQQADAIGSMVVMGLTLLGGNFVPINQAPLLFRQLSLLTPNGWALRSFTDLIADGGGVTSILPALGAITAFGLVTGTIAFARARKLVAA